MSLERMRLTSLHLGMRWRRVSSATYDAGPATLAMMAPVEQSEIRKNWDVGDSWWMARNLVLRMTGRIYNDPD